MSEYRQELDMVVFNGEITRRYLATPAGKDLIKSVKKIADDARDELVSTDPKEFGLIAQLQERVKAHLHLVGLLEQSVNLGDIAYNQIEESFNEA